MHVFLDFEASSLSKHSYPIEVGWVFEDGVGEGYLIRPAPNWTDWDDTAQAVHGISREQLQADGVLHDVVCTRVVEIFDGNVVYASAPSWDGHWLSMLLRAAGRPRHLLRLKDTDEAFKAAAGGALDRVASARKEISTQAVAHRAVEDARREWSIWMALSR